MTITEAERIIEEAMGMPMFSDQEKQLGEILGKVGGIKKDIEAAYKRQQNKKSRRSSADAIPSPENYEITKEFANHLDTLSRLADPKQWAQGTADGVDIELGRVKKYSEIYLAQTEGFVEEWRKTVCADIADVTLDGESKQWISTVVGIGIDIVLLVFYGLVLFKVGPFRYLDINDALAEFIGAVGSVVTVAATLAICAIINRISIQKFDKDRLIKYSELVRASKRNSFKKSAMLMSFGEDFKEAKELNGKIHENTNRLLEYSETAIKERAELQKKIEELEKKVEEGAGAINECTRKEAEKLQERISCSKTSLWKCKVCYGENCSNEVNCRYCETEKTIAVNCVKGRRREFEPELKPDGYYWCQKKMVCLPECYNGEPLKFDALIRDLPKTIFVPKAIKVITKSSLLKEIDKVYWDKEITLLYEGPETKEND